MLLKITDFNAAGGVVNGLYANEWLEIKTTLENMPLHLKASDQAGIQGNAIFDPVGTNAYVQSVLTSSSLDWSSKTPIPIEFAFLGTDIDFTKHGALLEIQFSNYPFLLNNILRSDFFFKSQTTFGGYVTKLIVIVTKARMFPSSNSTLYYEQAVSQLTALATHNVFSAPIRLVGLFEQSGTVVPAKFTGYHEPRYSRTVVSQSIRQCKILTSTGGQRCRLEVTS